MAAGGSAPANGQVIADDGPPVFILPFASMGIGVSSA
jgi:hypothetical protein